MSLQVFFNEAFEQLEDRHIHTPVGGSQAVNIGGRDVTLRRIDTSRKPSHTAIDQTQTRVAPAPCSPRDCSAKERE